MFVTYAKPSKRLFQKHDALLLPQHASLARTSREHAPYISLNSLQHFLKCRPYDGDGHKAGDPRDTTLEVRVMPTICTFSYGG